MTSNAPLSWSCSPLSRGMRRRIRGSPVSVTAVVVSVSVFSVWWIGCSAAIKRAGSVPSSQPPSLVIPIGTTSYFSLSRFAITEVAEASDTSCSPERPPKTSPTRIFCFFSGILFPPRYIKLALQHIQHSFHVHAARAFDQHKIGTPHVLFEQVGCRPFRGLQI